MSWRQPGYRPLANAITASFHQTTQPPQLEFAHFTAAQWRRTWFWIDASGLALYFLRNSENANIISSLDPETVRQLRSKYQMNRERSAALFAEFCALNDAFTRANIIFANLKGFTLSPHSCPDPTLRLQLDLDFLLRTADLVICKQILENRGYKLSARTPATWEFKAAHIPSKALSNPYQKSSYRSVELHVQLKGLDLSPTAADELLERRVNTLCCDQLVPALAPADQFISQALHILGHLRSAGTRPAWLLEFKQHVNTRAADPHFWLEVQRIAQTDPLIPVAIGTSMILSHDLFGLTIPASMVNWTERSVPGNVRTWLKHYGREAVLADFPGTKLYLLLERELALANVLPQTAPSLHVLPALCVPRIFRKHPDETSSIRLLRWRLNSRYILFRLRFHITQGLLYILELLRWKLFLRPASSFSPLQRLTKRKQVRDNSTAVVP